MKIGLVFDDSLDRLDGVQQYIVTLGNYFKTQGHRVYFLTGQTNNHDDKNVYSLSKNINIKFNKNTLSTPLFSKKYREIKTILDDLNLDIIHVQLPYSPIMSGKVIRYALRNNIPVVGTFQIMPYTRLQALGTALLGTISARQLRRFKFFYSLSKPAQTFSKKYYKISSSVLGVPIDLSKYDQNFGRVIENKILYLGRLVKRKAPINLLKALLYLKNNNQLPEGLVVNMAGSGYQKTELEDFVYKNNLASIVNFLGYISEEDKVNLLRTSSLSVFTSVAGESFGVVLIEALASNSTIVLAANNPGYESVMHDLPEQLYEANDYIELAKKILLFLNNQKTRKETVYKGYLVAKSFDINLIGRRILSDYSKVLSKRTNS